MRIKSIQLSWFRGAAEPVSLELDCTSVVVYGTNGSGKSSFVDAIEYLLNEGKIRHLAHEYSGKRQEKAIPNTHTPKGRIIELDVVFKDDADLRTVIAANGTAATTGSGADRLRTWDCRRTILRQDEVASFIHDTKGGKYSALLPLLGLSQLESAAENLRQLAKSVEEQARIRETRARLKDVEAKRKAVFGAGSDADLCARIDHLHSKYCAGGSGMATSGVASRCEEVKAAIDARVASSSADQRRFVAIQDAARLDLKGQVSAVRSASFALAGAVEPLIAEKLAVLESAGAFVALVGEDQEVQCPACGTLVSAEAFRSHVISERGRLQALIEAFDSRKTVIEQLCDSLKALKAALGKSDVASWRAAFATGPLADGFSYLENVNADALRTSCGEGILAEIEGKLVPLVDAAAAAATDAPPDAKELSADNQVIEAAKLTLLAAAEAEALARAEALVSFISSLEKVVREEIRLRSKKIIDEISDDIRSMWAILHPSEAIEDVHLYLPADVDKAIDIGLTFYGVTQESPRLTLSEGHRNSLGLCIFLAMAKREAEDDRPLFLDDVVVSLDRNHRGMIAELLTTHFSGRQVVVLTHDREWYTELRQQLDGKGWAFKALLPYDTPELGIRWSEKTTTFDDARAALASRPDSAGNDARKIMDIELALIAERMQIRVPYLRGDKNDKRLAHDLLERLIAEGKKCFQKKGAPDYEPFTNAIDAFEKADDLLVSWANRASHSFDVVRPEAAKLIEACERAIASFKCPSCHKPGWFATAGGPEWTQCQCGEIRWRYGKAQ